MNNLQLLNQIPCQHGYAAPAVAPDNMTPPTTAPPTEMMPAISPISENKPAETQQVALADAMNSDAKAQAEPHVAPDVESPADIPQASNDNGVPITKSAAMTSADEPFNLRSYRS